MRLLLLALFSALLFSCENLNFQPKEELDAIARVGNTFLYQSEVDKLGLTNAEPEDSSKIVDAYIDNWVHQEAYLQYAREQLSTEQLVQIKQKVYDYEQSLYTHLYEQQMVANKLDTVITEEEIQTYYTNHIKDFEISEPIYRFVAIKRDSKFTDIKSLIEKIDLLTEQGNDAEIKEYCTYAIACQTNAEQWFSENQLSETFGAPTSNIDINLRTYRLQRIEHQDYYYLCKILERKNSGSYPIEFVTEEIKKNILRKREKDFVDNLRTQIISKAKNNNEIEIYE